MYELPPLNMPTIIQPIQSAKPCLIEIRKICPICESGWKATYRESLTKIKDIAGATGEVFIIEETKGIKLDSSGWGAHALCGTCYAMRMATIRPDDGGRSIVPWSSKDEANMFGKLKYQQNRYAAVAIVLGPATGQEELIDEQRARRIEIIGLQNTLISEKRLKALGLEKWMWRT